MIPSGSSKKLKTASSQVGRGLPQLEKEIAEAKREMKHIKKQHTGPAI